jgi:phage gp46-like protein
VPEPEATAPAVARKPAPVNRWDLLARLREIPGVRPAREQRDRIEALPRLLRQPLHPEVRDRLIALLTEVDPACRRSVAETFAVLEDDREAAETLAAMLWRDGLPRATRLALIVGVARARAEPALDWLIPRLEESDVLETRAIVEALGAIGGPRANRVLLARLRAGSDPTTRRALERALANDRSIRDELAAVLPAASREMRLSTVRILGAGRDPSAIDALRPLVDSDAETRIEVVRALSRIDGPEVARLLLEIRALASPVERAEIRLAMGRTRSPETAAIYGAAWDDLDEKERLALLRTGRAAGSLARRGLEDPSSRVRAAAMDLLEGDETIVELLAYLDDARDPVERDAALRALLASDSEAAARIGANQSDLLEGDEEREWFAEEFAQRRESASRKSKRDAP